MLNYDTENQHRTIPAWIEIIIIIIALALTAWLIIANSNKTQPAPTANQSSAPSAQSEKSVFSYVGTIQSISDNEIILLISANRNNLNSNRLVAVTYDDQTAITSRSIPRTLPTDFTDEQRKNLFKKETIPSSALQIDDDITVAADIDISNLDRFRATSIEVRTVIDN